MAREVINIGTAPNDGTGDPLRTAFTKCNSNFAEVYSRYQENVPSSAVGAVGDKAGMCAGNATHFYYCFQDWDGSSEIWRRIAGSSF